MKEVLGVGSGHLWSSHTCGHVDFRRKHFSFPPTFVGSIVAQYRDNELALWDLILWSISE